MRNVCFFNSVKFWGGGEKLHYEYAIEFQKKGYAVSLVADAHSSLSEKGVNAGFKVFDLSVGNLSFLNPVKLLRLAAFYKKQQIDTVIFSGSHDLKLGGIAAKLAGVKSIVYLRGLAVPVSKSILNRFLFKDVLTHIVANSEETARTIIKNLKAYVPADKIKVIYHGIAISGNEENLKTDLPEIKDNANGIILGNAGRLTEQKGQHYLIEIAKILKDRNLDFTVFIAGTGELAPELHKSIESHGLENEVMLLGFMEEIDVFMQSIDIFLLSSIWEGFGYVLVEAMTQAKPVVAFDISSNPEIVSDGNTGFLVDYPDLEGFAERIIQLSEDVELRKNFGEAGRKIVLDRFQLQDRIDEFESYLLETSSSGSA